jgi:transposase-like protein
MPPTLSGVQREVEASLGHDLDADLVRRYAHLDQPLSKIAADYGVTKATVSRWLRDAGVQLRPRGRRPATLTPVRLEPPS